MGLYSVSGQSALPSMPPAGQPALPAFPDRISLPLCLDVRPLAFFVPHGEVSYRARLLEGVALQLGPAIEITRTSSDLDSGIGLHLALAAELPLHGKARHGISLRLSGQLAYAPLVSLNNGLVRSSAFDNCDTTAPDCTPLTEHKHGYAPVLQGYLGVVYYP